MTRTWVRARTILASALVLTIAITAACSERNSREVSRSEFGERWPFTVDRGVVRCDNNAITFATDGNVYAVNGVAKSRGIAAIEPIWRATHVRMNYEPLTRIAVAERKAVYRGIIDCEDKQEDDPDIQKAAKVAEQCKAALRRHYSITDKEIEQIGSEGLAENWPPLPPVRVSIGPIIDLGLSLCDKR